MSDAEPAVPDLEVPELEDERVPPPSRAVAVAVCAAAAFAMSLVHDAMHAGEILGGLSDEALLVPIAQATKDPGLFAGDKWLAVAAPVYSVPYSHLLGTLLGWMDDPVEALRMLAVPFHLLFLVGCWRVAARVAGEAAGALFVGVLLLPPFAHLTLAPGAALPRDLVFALLPWFWLGVESARPRGVLPIALAFLALGLVTNVHPITGLHLAGWLLLVGLDAEKSRRGIVHAAAGLGSFLVGASPYVVQYLSRPAAPGTVPEEILRWRLEGIISETPAAWATRMEPVLWLGAAALVVVLASRRTGAVVPRALVAAAVVAVALAAAGPLLGQVADFVRSVQLARFARFASWSLLAVLVVGVVGLVRERAFAAVALAAALAALAPAGPSLVQAAFGGAGARGPISHVARWAERGARVPLAPEGPAEIVQRETPGEPSADDGRARSFLAVAEVAREDTPRTALFLVPPEHWGAFRAYARRPIAISRKDGGTTLTFLGAQGMDWFREYAETVRVYAEGTDEDWRRLADAHGASYVVSDPSAHPPADWPVLFASGPYRINAVRR